MHSTASRTAHFVISRWWKHEPQLIICCVKATDLLRFIFIPLIWLNGAPSRTEFPMGINKSVLIRIWIKATTWAAPFFCLHKKKKRKNSPPVSATSAYSRWFGWIRCLCVVDPPECFSSPLVPRWVASQTVCGFWGELVEKQQGKIIWCNPV